MLKRVPKPQSVLRGKLALSHPGEHTPEKAEEISHDQPQQEGCRQDDVRIESQCFCKLPVKESRQSSCAAAGRTGGDMKKISPQAKVRPLGQGFRRNEAKYRQPQRQSEKARHSAREMAHLLPLPKRIPLGVRQLVHGDQNEIDQPPDAAAPEGHQLEDAQSHVAQIKPVNPQSSKQDG